MNNFRFEAEAERLYKHNIDLQNAFISGAVYGSKHPDLSFATSSWLISQAEDAMQHEPEDKTESQLKIDYFFKGFCCILSELTGKDTVKVPQDNLNIETVEDIVRKTFEYLNVTGDETIKKIASEYISGIN